MVVGQIVHEAELIIVGLEAGLEVAAWWPSVVIRDESVWRMTWLNLTPRTVRAPRSGHRYVEGRGVRFAYRLPYRNKWQR